MGEFYRLNDSEYDLYREKYSSFIEHIQTKEFFSIGSGSFRSVFRRKNVVIKVPRNLDGIEDNISECLGWHKYHNEPTSRGYYLAPCRLLSNKCLMMVAVDRVYSDEAPKWSYTIDSRQVGRYKNRIVAYDYGLELEERKEWEKEWASASVSFFKSSYFYKKDANGN